MELVYSGVLGKNTTVNATLYLKYLQFLRLDWKHSIPTNWVQQCCLASSYSDDLQEDCSRHTPKSETNKNDTLQCLLLCPSLGPFAPTLCDN